MKERTVLKRIVKSKCLADMLVWLGFEYEKTENGYEFERSHRFESAWKDVHSLRQFYNNDTSKKYRAKQVKSNVRLSIEPNAKKVLEINFDDDCRCFEEGEHVRFIIEDGSSACGDIIEIRENSVIINEDVTCEDGEEIPFKDIYGIL